MIKRLSLTSRLALLFAACTAVVSLIAGVLFNRASEAHFMELDQQQLESKLVALRSTRRCRLTGRPRPAHPSTACRTRSPARPHLAHHRGGSTLAGRRAQP